MLECLWVCCWWWLNSNYAYVSAHSGFYENALYKFTFTYLLLTTPVTDIDMIPAYQTVVENGRLTSVVVRQQMSSLIYGHVIHDVNKGVANLNLWKGNLPPLPLLPLPSLPLPFLPPSPLPARERCELPVGSGAKPQPLHNLVHVWAKNNGSSDCCGFWIKISSVFWREWVSPCQPYKFSLQKNTKRH